MRECDSQLFNGFGSLPGVFDDSMVSAAVGLVDAVAKAMASKLKSRIIVSGCGIAGRIAWQICQAFNALAAAKQGAGGEQANLFHYLCAGGDRALLLSESDLPEDDAERGRRDLQQAMAGQDQVVFIGISSGLSAPYIAGQLDYCADVLQAITPGAKPAASASSSSAAAAAAASKNPSSLHVALVGFTPTARAKDVAIDRWDAASSVVATGAAGAAASASAAAVSVVHTFRQVVRRLEQMAAAPAAGAAAATSGSVTILTPVVGPEFVTGSTRLKSGSAAKMILESVFAAALARAPAAGVPLATLAIGQGAAIAQDSKVAYLDCLQEYERAFRQTYMQIASLAPVLDLVSSSLAPPVPTVVGGAAVGGRLFYLALSGSAGRMALVDSSEMHDTFGNGYEQVRAFVLGGLRAAVRDPASFDAKPIANGSSSSAVAVAAAGLLNTVFNVSLTDFKDNVLATLSPKDTVLVLLDAEADAAPAASAAAGAAAAREDAGWGLEQTQQLFGAVRARGSKMVLVHVTSSQQQQKSARPQAVVAALSKKSDLFDLSATVTLPASSLLQLPSGAGENSLLSFSWKLVLNALSTAAHVQQGFVLGNRMVNLAVTNLKLYERAVALIAELTQVTPEVAERQLLRSIYQIDQVTEDVRNCKVSKPRIRRSTKAERLGYEHRFSEHSTDFLLFVGLSPSVCLL